MWLQQKPTKTKTYIGQGFNFLPIGPGVQITDATSQDISTVFVKYTRPIINVCTGRYQRIYCDAVEHIYNKAIIKCLTLLLTVCVQKASKVKLGQLPKKL